MRLLRFFGAVGALFFVFVNALNAEPSEKIEVIESLPIDEEYSDGDLQRFIDDGLLSAEEAGRLREHISDDESDENALVNIYKKINNAKKGDSTKSSGDSSIESNANLSDLGESSADSTDFDSTARIVNNSAKIHDDEVPSLLENVYGHIGFFGKTNANKSVKEHFLLFSGSVGLVYDFKEMVFLDIGIYGASNFIGVKPRATRAKSNFIAHRANLKYIARDEFQNEVFAISAGRFQARRDWIRNFVQGVSVNVNYEWFGLWLDWVDEQAHAYREYVSDFDTFKKRYNNHWLIATGLGAVRLFGVDVQPYYYHLHKNLWALGSKLGLDIDFANKKWRSVSTAHYVYARNKRDFGAFGGFDDVGGIAGNSGDSSQILLLEQVFRWRVKDKAVSIGVGYVRVFGASFELANVGNMSRFEGYNTQGYGIMGAGGIDNGGNASNMFFADTQSFYGFVGFKISDFSMSFLGRNSQGKNSFSDLSIAQNATSLNQHQYSLSARWRIIEGLYVGGVGAFLLENKVNKSYAKGFVEFRI